MKTKIEWYREVLELEPHSKLFFPLARLYVAEERYTEALETLSTGLRQHPEFLEARLLLLEVLNALGKAGDLSEQARGLAETFSGYYTFWQTWAHLLSLEHEGKDTALAVNFLASHFRGNPLSWADVIERGIRSLVFEEPGVSESVIPAEAVERTVVEPDEPDRETSPASEPSEQDGMPSVSEDASDRSSNDLMEADVDVLHAFSDKTAAELDKSENALQKHDDVRFEGDEDDAEPVTVAVRDTESAAVETDAEDEEEDEPFSLRTRTMADLLAEQGDYEGALDIYRELLSVTPSGDGRDVLEGLIKEMSVNIREKKGLLPSAPGKRKASSKSGNSENGGLSGKKKLIDTLELLARRLEARGAG